MNQSQARSLIRDGVKGTEWADLGAGEGTFTLALASLLARGSTVSAVDRSARAVDVLHRKSWPPGVEVHAVQADFSKGLALRDLDGVLMANSLHFVPHQETVIELVSTYLRPGGRLLIVEYDRDDGDRWVPHPVSYQRLRQLSAMCGLSQPREIGRIASRYGREMYAAVVRGRGVRG